MLSAWYDPLTDIHAVHGPDADGAVGGCRKDDAVLLDDAQARHALSRQ